MFCFSCFLFVRSHEPGGVVRRRGGGVSWVDLLVSTQNSHEGPGPGLGREETAVGMFLPAVQSDASSTCSPFFFVEHHCNTFAVLRVIYSSHLFVLYGHVVLIYLGTCRPIPISPVTAKGATNTSGVVFHRSQRFKLLLRRTSLAFSLFVFGGEQQ